MNTVIAAIVGALAAGAVMVGGVNAAQDTPEPVAKSELYTYSSR